MGDCNVSVADKQHLPEEIETKGIVAAMSESKDTNLIILNGRNERDMRRKFMYLFKVGSSEIDYCCIYTYVCVCVLIYFLKLKLSTHLVSLSDIGLLMFVHDTGLHVQTYYILN